MQALDRFLPALPQLPLGDVRDGVEGSLVRILAERVLDNRENETSATRSSRWTSPRSLRFSASLIRSPSCENSRNVSLSMALVGK